MSSSAVHRRRSETGIVIRVLTRVDHAGVRQVLTRSFAPSQAEADLVDAILTEPVPHWIWVALIDHRVVGTIVYTRALRDGRPAGYHLAPVAVDPAHQGHGIGSRLVELTLPILTRDDDPVFVLGDPAFYQRFGFVRINQPACPFDPGNQHFQSTHAGHDAYTIGYEPPFNHLT